jgi:hypothetical protein
MLGKPVVVTSLMPKDLQLEMDASPTQTPSQLAAISPRSWDVRIAVKSRLANNGSINCLVERART